MRRLVFAVAILLALSPALGLADAKVDAEIKRIESALDQLYRSQQSLYQQFQMVQELRRSEAARAAERGAPAYGAAAPPIDYEVLQQERRRREERLRSLSDELDRLYADYQALEKQKRPLLDRLNELTRAE